MSHSVFISYSGPGEHADSVTAWFEGHPLTALKSHNDVQAVDLFSFEKAHDPYLDDGDGPLLLVELHVDGVDAMQSVLGAPDVLAALGDPADIPSPGCAATLDAFRVIRQAVAGEDVAMPDRVAPMSYVVRYFRPAEDEKAFTDFYVANHPQVEAEFPKIKNIMSYLPVAWDNPTKIPMADCMLGNEVVFDTVADFDTAMASDVRHKMREDFLNFPKFSGNVTHFMMRRKRV